MWDNPTMMAAPSFPLIRTKLHVPGLRAQAVPRPRLLALLEDRSTVRLFAVTAPAGFGKTTLVADWLHHTNTPAAWLSLDERDNDFTRFLVYVIASIQTQLPTFGQELAASMQQPPPPSGQLAMDALLAELATSSQSFVLVLDDYHLIQSDEIHQRVSTLIDYLPSQVRVIITSRVEPDLPLALWRARGQLIEVTAGDLRFDAQEAQSFLRTTMQLDLPAQVLDDLEQKTEGWAAGLQLAALSVRGAADPVTAIQNLSGSDRHVADYLISEVMARQPTAVQHFLEQTSILEQFNSSLCDFLLESHHSRHWLETIDRENLFLIPLDQRREWYRYHHLFRDLLRTRLERTQGAEGVTRLHRRAARWHADHGQTDDAFRHALAGDDAPSAAQLVAETPLELLWQPGGLGTVRRWVDDLPDTALRQFPRAALMGAIACLLVGDISNTERYTVFTGSVPELAQDRALIQAVFARNEGRIDEARALLHTLVDQSGPTQWIRRAIARLQIAVIQMELGNMDESAELLHQMRMDLDLTSHAGLSMLLQAASFECSLAYLQGDLSQAEDICRTAMSTAQASGRILPMVGQLHSSLAGIAYQRNDLDLAQQELTRALHWGERTGITDILFNAYDTEIKLLCVRGERERALARMEQIRAMYEKSNFPHIIRIGQAEEAEMHLRLGNLAQATAWARRSGESLGDAVQLRNRSVSHILADIYLSAARVNHDTTRVGEVLDLAQRLDAAAAEKGQVLPRISALLLQVRALTMQGKAARARAQLAQALALAEPGRIMRLFLESGPEIRPMLDSLAAEKAGNAFVAALLQAFDQEAHPASSLPDPLTGREQEILGLIAVGLSNREIEERLVVSHNTLRTHIKNLYSKLAVSSRTQAVAKGQELGLV